METVPWLSSRLLDDGPIFLAASLRDSQFQVAEFSDGESIFVSARALLLASIKSGRTSMPAEGPPDRRGLMLARLFAKEDGVLRYEVVPAD